ncbi:MAG: alpha-galactosidase [Chitinophagales bacterium]|nr:alpha-galactosidase [Chitinophagales bacterium]
MQFKDFTLAYNVQGISKEFTSTAFTKHETDDFILEFLIDGDDALKYSVVLQTKNILALNTFEINTIIDYSESKGCMINGFQSWTNSKVYYTDEKIKPANKLVKGVAFNYGDYSFYDYPQKNGVLHSYSYSYIKYDKRKIELLASLDESIGYTIFEHHTNENICKIKKDISGKIIENSCTLLHFIRIDDFEELAFEKLFAENNYRPKVVPAIGWTSWYYYYTKISEVIILQSLESFKKNNININIFQIDDGYQQAVGDWLNINKKFPNGMQYLAQKIHEFGAKAGIWLAPFACEHNSFIVKEKSNWILKDAQGKFVTIGYNPLWSGKFYALDFYNEEVKQYIKKVFNIILNEWNYDLVKLDFLYGVACIPQHGKSRGEIMLEAMQFLRDCVGNKMILACGVPLSAANQTTDYCRIGPDIHLTWDFKLLKWINARERPSTYHAIHNTISRRHLSKHWFLNDPDVFILRKNRNRLSFDEQYSLLLANLLFGDLIFTSDNIGEYNEQQLWWYKSIFPLLEKEEVKVQQEKDFYLIHFKIHQQYYTALFNLSNHDKLYKLPNGMFFDNVTEKWLNGNKKITVKKHQSMCLLNVGFTPFALAGSKGHFFAGAEVKHTMLSGNELEFVWQDDILNAITIYYKVPKDYSIESINGDKNFEIKQHKNYDIIIYNKK